MEEHVDLDSDNIHHKPRNQTTPYQAIQTQTQYLNKKSPNTQTKPKGTTTTTLNRTQTPPKPDYQWNPTTKKTITKPSHQTDLASTKSHHQIDPASTETHHQMDPTNTKKNPPPKPATDSTPQPKPTTKTQQPPIRSNQNLVKWEEIDERNMLWIEKEEWEICFWHILHVPPKKRKKKLI